MKRQFLMKIGSLLLIITLLTGLCGCKIGGKEIVVNTSLSGTEVFRIGSVTCSLAKAKVVLLNYQNLYGTVYGVNLWEQESGGDSLAEYIKDLTISQLAKVVAMNLLAEEKRVALTDTEKKRLTDAASEYYETLNAEERSYLKVNKSDIEDLYLWYGLADKLYQTLTEDVHEEVSDDEARVMTAQQIFVTSKESADAVVASLAQGTEFTTVQATYNEGDQTEWSFGRTDVPDEVEQVAFALSDGETSGMIEAEDGYYFIKCISHYDQELSDANKETIYENRKKEAFDDVYDEFVEKTSSRMNETLWDSVEPEWKDSLSTDSFFTVLEEHWGL